MGVFLNSGLQLHILFSVAHRNGLPAITQQAVLTALIWSMILNMPSITAPFQDILMSGAAIVTWMLVACSTDMFLLEREKSKFQKMKIKCRKCWCALKVQMLIFLQHQLGQKVEGQARGQLWTSKQGSSIKQTTVLGGRGDLLPDQWILHLFSLVSYGSKTGILDCLSARDFDYWEAIPIWACSFLSCVGTGFIPL